MLILEERVMPCAEGQFTLRGGGHTAAGIAPAATPATNTTANPNMMSATPNKPKERNHERGHKINFNQLPRVHVRTTIKGPANLIRLEFSDFMSGSVVSPQHPLSTTAAQCTRSDH